MLLLKITALTMKF